MARSAIIWILLLWIFFGHFGSPYLRIGKPCRYSGFTEVPYLGITGRTYLDFDPSGPCPLIAFAPLQNSVFADFWSGLVAIKRFAFN
jgi:hypothetical protein